jgi:hypothetical protein
MMVAGVEWATGGGRGGGEEATSRPWAGGKPATGARWGGGETTTGAGWGGGEQAPGGPWGSGELATGVSWGWNPPAMCLCDPAPPLHPASSVPCAPLPLSATWRPAAATCVEGEGRGQIYLGLIHGVARTGVDSLAKARQKSSGSNRFLESERMSSSSAETKVPSACPTKRIFAN